MARYPVRLLPFLYQAGRNIRPGVMPAPGSFAAEEPSRSLAMGKLRVLRAFKLLSPPHDKLGGLVLGEDASLEQNRLLPVTAGPRKSGLEAPPRHWPPAISSPNSQ